MKPKTREITTCTIPIEVGKTYLDTWGYKHAVLGELDPEQWGNGPPKVWAMDAHYYKETGLGGKYPLVSLPPEAEMDLWAHILDQIITNNSAAQLKPVAEQVSNIKRRMAELRASLKQ